MEEEGEQEEKGKNKNLQSKATLSGRRKISFEPDAADVSAGGEEEGNVDLELPFAEDEDSGDNQEEEEEEEEEDGDVPPPARRMTRRRWEKK